MLKRIPRLVAAAAAMFALVAQATDECDLPIVDLAGDIAKDFIVAAGTAQIYQGHSTTVTTKDGRIIAVWGTPHAGHCGPAAESIDGGRTWTRIDGRFPADYSRHVNCPSIYRLVGPDGKARLWVWSAAKMRDTDPDISTLSATDYTNGLPCRRDPTRAMPSVMSEDEGFTWTEVAPLGPKFLCTMAFTSIVRLKNGSYLGVFHTGESCGMENPRRVWQSITTDGGFTWSDPKLICLSETREACEPYVFRSPDGDELCCLIRDQNHDGRSMMIFSTDEGESWTSPVDTLWGLTGDRHQGVTLPDGRLVIAFRDMAVNSPTWGDFVAWIGTYDELKTCTVGNSYRVRLLTSYAQQKEDCGYPGIELVSAEEGLIAATTYIKYRNDNCQNSVVTKVFTVAETDQRREQEGELEYVSSDGTQWIDTGIVNDTDTDEVVIDFRLDGVVGQSSLQNGIYGARNTSIGDRNFSYAYNPITGQLVFSCLTGATSLKHASRADCTVGRRYRAFASKATRYTEDVETGEILGRDDEDAGSFTASGNAYLFNLNTTVAIEPSKIRLYSCKISRNGGLIRDFVPYRVTTNGVSRTCLYDRAKGGFYFSKGSTDLIPGPEREIPFDGPVISFTGIKEKEADPVRASVEYEVESLGEGESLTGDMSLVWYGMDCVARTNRLAASIGSPCVRTNELALVTGADLAKSDIVRAFLVLTVSNGRVATSPEVLSLHRAKCETEFLPDGYERLDCVKSANSQYVDTKFFPGANFAIWMRFAQEDATVNQSVFGAAPDSNNKPPCVRGQLRKTGTGAGTDQGSGFGMFDLAGDDASGKHMTTDGPKTALGTSVHELFISNETMTLDGDSSGFTLQASSGGNPLNVTLSKTLYLLHWNGGNTANERFRGRLYGCRIYDGETVVRDFIPARRTAGTVQVGLYDLAAKDGDTVFYPSASETAFVAGDVVSSGKITVAAVKRSETKVYLTLVHSDVESGRLFAAAGRTYGGDDLVSWEATELNVKGIQGASTAETQVRVIGIPVAAKYLRLYFLTDSGMVSWSNGLYLPAIPKPGMILIVY